MRRRGDTSRACLAQVFLTQTHLAIAMEYAQGGDLFNYTLGHRPHGRLAEQQARWIFQQLIIGLDYCHRRVRASALPCTRLFVFERDTRAKLCRTPFLGRLCCPNCQGVLCFMAMQTYYFAGHLSGTWP